MQKFELAHEPTEGPVYGLVLAQSEYVLGPGRHGRKK